MMDQGNAMAPQEYYETFFVLPKSQTVDLHRNLFGRIESKSSATV